MKKVSDVRRFFHPRRTVLACVACLLLLTALCTVAGVRAGASDSDMLVVKEINYENSTITLLSNAGDTKVYFSNSAKKTWETMPGTFANGEITIDISWISVSSNYTLTFKGDKSTAIGTVVLPKQATNFRVTYKANAEDTPFTFTNRGTRTIQWRKDGTASWNVWQDATKNEDLSYLKGNGAKIYFRLAPVNGTSSSDTGYRPSKEIAVKIPAKKAAPTVKVDASTFLIPLKSGMSYRAVKLDEDDKLLADGVEWIKISSTKDYSLSAIAVAAMYSGTSTVTTEKLALQFKTNATNSAQESRVTTVIIPAQEPAPTEDSAGASLSYTSSTSFELVIQAATEEKPFEYCIVDKDDYDPNSFSYEDVVWTTVNSNKAVALTSTKVKAGSHVYFRMKTRNAQGDEKFALASKEKELTGAEGIAYPDAMKIDNLTTIVAPAGTINTGDYGQSKQFTLYSYAKTKVSSISFRDSYGNTLGNVACTSVVAKNTSAAATPDKAYIITTKITSTAELEKVKDALNHKLYAYIKLENGEEIKSTDTLGVILYLYPPTEVDIPEETDKSQYGKYFEDYTDDFSRVYLSKVTDDKGYFKFIVDFGTQSVMSTSTGGEATSDKMQISSITYDAYALGLKTFANTSGNVDDAEADAYRTGPADVMVCYEDYKNSDNEPARRAYVTVHVNRFEGDNAITEIGKQLPLVIKLNNGEVLDQDVNMTLVETATLNNAPIAWTITEGSLTESSTSNVFDKDGNVISTVTNAVNNYKLNLTKMNTEYSVSISDVTWNGTSILYDASLAGDEIEITLSNAKINKLTPNGGTSTYNVVITLSNGYEIKTGCKLTILKKSN